MAKPLNIPLAVFLNGFADIVLMTRIGSFNNKY